MPTLAAPLDFAKLEGRNFRAHQLAAAPGSPVTGQLYYDTGSNSLFYWNGTAWIAASGGTPADATTSTKGIVQLAGDLAGTAASPQIAAGVITDVEVAAANKDGASGTASMRTLGLGTGQAAPGNFPLQSLTAPSASLSLNNQRIISMADPTGAQDAATKAYVDSVAAGFDPKASVRAASTVNLAVTGTQTVDGVALIVGDRVLVKNQSTQSGNGIYIVASGAWTRATDADTSADVTPGIFVFVEEGTTQGNTGWVLTTDAPITLGTTSLVFTQFSGPGEYVWGNGLAATGNTIDVGGTANRITVAADSVDISTAYVGQATITTLGTITTGVWNGTAIPVANGGTGSSTAKAARETGLAAPGYYNNAATHGSGTTITITAATHGLRASRGLIVQVQDNATGNVLLADVAVASNGDVTVTFGASQTANTILVTILG
jgi:hypothetical protein